MDYDLLNSLGIVISENKKKLFEDYIKYFMAYNAHTNLISKNDEKFLFEKHIFDSLAFNLFVKKYNLPKTIMDIGTGGGFPSVILALIYDDINILAVDSTSKKIKFINEIINKLNLINIKTENSRIEELKPEMKSSFDVVTSRALGTLALILEYAIPYLKVGGYFVAYKSIDSEKELSEAKYSLNVFNTQLIDIIEYKLPLKENFNRKLLIFRKNAQVPSIYPRKYNIIKKNPM